MDDETVDDVLFQAVHRLPGRKTHKNIIVRFVSLADKERVFRAASNLPPKSGHSVFTDIPPVLAQKRLTLHDKRKNMTEQEKTELETKIPFHRTNSEEENRWREGENIWTEQNSDRTRTWTWEGSQPYWCKLIESITVNYSGNCVDFLQICDTF